MLNEGKIDGDNLNDVVFANRQPYYSSNLYWYKNPAGAGSWTRHTIDTLSTEHLKGSPPEIADIDLDGKPDVICYRYDSSATYWYKNPGGGSSWAKNKIYDGNIGDHKGVGDADNDGDPDIIVGGYLYVNPKHLEAGLNGCWYLDEGERTTAEDSSGFDNDGTIYGATWTTGKVGYGLDFDGVDDYVDCGNDASLDITDAITIEAWVNSDTFTPDLDYQTIAVKKNAYYFQVNSSGRLVYGATAYVSSEWPIPSLNEWTHVAVTVTGTTVKFYINGDLDSTKSQASPQTSNNHLGIGANLDSNGNPVLNYERRFDGTIDEVRIYERALTPDEVYERYLEGS